MFEDARGVEGATVARGFVGRRVWGAGLGVGVGAGLRVDMPGRRLVMLRRNIPVADENPGGSR
jgi:hypothetical protein